MTRARRSALVALLIAAMPSAASAAAPEQLNVNIDGIGGISAPIQLVVVLTLLSFVPAMLVIMTCFTRIVIVFHFLRQALVLLCHLRSSTSFSFSIHFK